ncbi:diadenosine tetraphosphate hydrolase [Candidatus Woesebacteria bacterium RIFCSPLOWO2_01_FULL_39_23]|uniref:Diadenosine tetraphosphate hydrolase n=1 Tax=Candidatus Woesebacteria bacterium RIFCSPHIGHO2_01_FULL_40_22 TaxID=1802499 RepID=A0A1F7YI35_9BACT|nr:MAG: diadenosine tetraphosphate hydrolase [Candidatus Woesebacteria bacterium RBG_16_40_11]OGM26932.1 MAG: diadenosine tetraphosphate hydrolase [Candidatus Woesebacteria bacterium RIFCSPHIGHO2_01_FULL_40_22]OGM37341.1 MAG: diadenosine tetraphosphate hydrolase [Candidatus Woesebacteria bacterium RIFCSPHIGHO2_12_FULL_38_9]OGM63206.1 MAG: diadenosine tetraphosphate hydrolase [Candidatus Woesebacteria bacterium RIFCSPLOWO2_01_FULL_39_23]
MEDCIFCKIVKGQSLSYKILEDKKHVAFLSLYPNTPGFTVVATKKHKPSYAFENDDKTVTDLVLFTKKVAKLLDASFEGVGRCGMFFEGFGIDHLHSKLFPMHGTADMERWKPIESNIDVFFEKYPGYLSSHASKREDDKELERIKVKILETAKKLNL